MRILALLVSVAVLGTASVVSADDQPMRVIQLSGVQGQYTILIPENRPAVSSEAPNALRGDGAQQKNAATPAPKTENAPTQTTPSAVQTPRQGTNSN